MASLDKTTVRTEIDKLKADFQKLSSDGKLILKAPVIHCDETGIRVDKKNHWIHVYAAGDITLKFLHRKRGKEAVEAIGIIACYFGIIIHDCWQSYLSYKHLGHGLCGSQLLRDLEFVIESGGYKWARQMKRLA